MRTFLKAFIAAIGFCFGVGIVFFMLFILLMGVTL